MTAAPTVEPRALRPEAGWRPSVAVPCVFLLEHPRHFEAFRQKACLRRNSFSPKLIAFFT
jgi:hypothetical protein